MTAGKIEAAKKLLEGGIPRKDVAEQLGVSISRLYHYLPAIDG
jgi:Trp operon repressor